MILLFHPQAPTPQPPGWDWATLQTVVILDVKCGLEENHLAAHLANTLKYQPAAEAIHTLSKGNANTLILTAPFGARGSASLRTEATLGTIVRRLLSLPDATSLQPLSTHSRTAIAHCLDTGSRQCLIAATTLLQLRRQEDAKWLSAQPTSGTHN